MRNLMTIILVFGAAIAAVEVFLNHGPANGSFLLVITYFTMVAQGCVALAAVGEVAKGLWLIPIRRDLLSLYPLLYFVALLFPLLGLRMDIYAWTENPTAWLSVNFFIVRNVVILFLTAWVGHMLARAVMKGSPNKNTFAVYYLFLFVTSQSLVAFDWVMSLEYPWISTLFGGYFFIEAIIMSLVVSAWVVFFRTRSEDPVLTETLRDTGKMMFGFCFMWGGFFFAQYLVIWYGNIPEEVDYVFKRVVPSPYWGLSRVVLLTVFLIPFVLLLSRKLKTIRPAMIIVGSIVMFGLFLEKIILITPVTPVNPVAAGLELLLMAGAFGMVYRTREAFMPQSVAGSHASGAGNPHAGELRSSH
jgi:hypothetical protein